MSLIKNFQEYGNHLTELEVECFHKLLSFQDLQPNLTISSLSEALNVSTTTIFRMVKKLNYKTFMDFAMIFYTIVEMNMNIHLDVIMFVILLKKKSKIQCLC